MKRYTLCAWRAVLLVVVLAMCYGSPARAEFYFGGNIGGAFGQKVRNVTANEDVNYPFPPQSVFPFTSNPLSALYPNSHYTPISIQGSVLGGYRAGYYFSKFPGLFKGLGVEFENIYSRANFNRQFTTITNPAFLVVGLGQDHFTEHQQPARGNVLMFAWNGVYRYKKPEKPFMPYIGLGPALFVIPLKGTGRSGITTDPPALLDPIGVAGPDIHTTAVHVGMNFKTGILYQIHKDWYMGAEYHLDWTPIGIRHFRSASEINGDYLFNSVSMVLQHSF